MSVISEYISSIEKIIEKTPHLLSDKIVADNRGDMVLFLKGEIIFTNHSELHFKEYIISIPDFKKLAYSYHYQDADKELIFRYDNAEHHPELGNFPHHKHVKDETFPAEEFSLENAMETIINQIVNRPIEL